MTFKNILLCLTIWGCISYNSFAQNTIFNNTSNEKQTIKYSAEQVSEESRINVLISEIAKSIPKRPDFTQFVIDFAQEIKVRQIDTTTFSVFAELKNFNFSGDIIYREINISNVLLPDVVSFALQIFRKEKNGNVLIKTYNFSNRVLVNNLGYFTIADTMFNDTVKNHSYEAVINNLSFDYFEYSKTKFFETVNLIYEYYQFAQDLGAIRATLAQINPDNIERVAFHDVELRQVESWFSDVLSKNFFTKLNLHTNDPVRYKDKMNDLEVVIAKVRAEINKNLEGLDKLYHKRGINELKENNFKESMHFFSKAIELNPTYAPSLTEIAFLEYLKGDISKAATIIINIQNNTLPDDFTKDRINEVSSFILKEIKSLSEIQIEKQKFVESLNLLDTALVFCQVSPHLNCLDTIALLITKSKIGVYESYITVANKAMENKHFEISKTYLEAAISYQQENKTHIITLLKVENTFQTLANEYIKHIINLNSKKEFFKSFQFIKAFENLCKQRPNIKCDNLDFINAEKTTQQYFYLSEINMGEKNLEFKFYEPAYNHFSNAYNLQGKYNLTPYEELKKLMKISAIPHLKEKIEKVNFGYERFSIGQIRDLYQHTDSVIKFLNIDKDTFLYPVFAKLKENLDKKICDSIKFDYYFYINDVEILITSKKFTETEKKIAQALDLVKNNAKCDIMPNEIIEINTSIQDAITWEKIMLSADTALFYSEYSKAVAQYRKAESNYKEFDLKEKFNIIQKPIIDFFVESNDTGFFLYGINMFYSNKDYDDAFMLLEMLRSKNYPAEKTEEIQKKLGNKLAIRDKIKDENSNFRINILKYTEGEEFFSYFSKSYRKTWRRY